MEAEALAPYESSLASAQPLAVVATDGQLVEFDVARWMNPVDAVDRTVLGRCVGPVLDVGCGPGRFVQALDELDIPALGLDIASTAVELTRRFGGLALLLSVFDPAPAEGSWHTVLLMDGNIGIGGDPRRLLTRIADLLSPSGRVLVEVATDPLADDLLCLRFVAAGAAVGPEFAWAQLGLRALKVLARQLDYTVGEVWSVSGRTFVALER